MFNELKAPALVLRSRPASADGIACPKCRWTGKEAGDGWTKFAWVSSSDAARYNVQDEAGKPVGECLMVSCQRCGFRWREEVAEPDKAEAVS